VEKMDARNVKMERLSMVEDQDVSKTTANNSNSSTKMDSAKSAQIPILKLLANVTKQIELRLTWCKDLKLNQILLIMLMYTGLPKTLLCSLIRRVKIIKAL
jgi:hypothetical protein